MSSRSDWPALAYEAIEPTLEYLHRISQIGGKYTLDLPFELNWGNVTLGVTPRGIATPLLHANGVFFRIEYALLDDRVEVTASTGRATIQLADGSVSEFYARFLAAVAPLQVPAPRTTLESEIADPFHFEADTAPRRYDPEVARRIWAALAAASGALEKWQSAYRGPRPPVGIMWGGFDLYAPRHNGRTIAPPSERPIFQQNGMSGETVAVGFTFGAASMPAAGVYAYISPPPEGIAGADFGVEGAAFNAAAGLVWLPWETVCASDDPQQTIVRFADAVYHAAVTLGGWPTAWIGPRHDGWYASSHLIA